MNESGQVLGDWLSRKRANGSARPSKMGRSLGPLLRLNKNYSDLVRFTQMRPWGRLRITSLLDGVSLYERARGEVLPGGK